MGPPVTVGRFSANQINLVSKSGTNNFNGSLFWFMRNNALDSHNFFQSDIAPLRQNRFGYVAGGPVYIPGVYDGRNKTFWLANYEGGRIRRGIDSFGNVPTADLLAGRFETPVMDPITGEMYPNGVIPTSQFSRLGNLARTKFFPAPNINLPQGNFRNTKSLPNDANQQTYRFDQMLGRLGTVFGRVTFGDFVNTRAGTNSPNGLGDTFFNQETTNWQVSHSQTFGPNIVNQVRVGYVEFIADQFDTPADQADVDALQLTGVFQNLADTQRATLSSCEEHSYSWCCAGRACRPRLMRASCSDTSNRDKRHCPRGGMSRPCELLKSSGSWSPESPKYTLLWGSATFSKGNSGWLFRRCAKR